MLCEITGMPENQIDDPNDEEAPDTPETKVCNYLNGEKRPAINIYDYSDKVLAACFRTAINVYRDFHFDAKLTDVENKLALLAEIKDHYTECLLELIDET